MKVLWDEKGDTLYVNGYQIAGEFFRALTEEPLEPNRPWRVMKRDKGIITMQAHECVDLKKLELPPEPSIPKVAMERTFLSWRLWEFETEHSKYRRAFSGGQRLMWRHFMICLGLIKGPIVESPEVCELLFREGTVNKGGLNSPPTTPRPSVAPAPQRPASTCCNPHCEHIGDHP